jgi:hypothetical protein
MQTRHEYAAANNLRVVTDDNTEFWALNPMTGEGFNIMAGRDDDTYCACPHDANNDKCGAAGYGDTMDAALHAMRHKLPAMNLLELATQLGAP